MVARKQIVSMIHPLPPACGHSKKACSSWTVCSIIKMLVYAAISSNLATARYVHMRRIACDAWSSLDHTEYTMNSSGYGWWQSYLYDFVDADHVVFAEEQDGVNRARLASALVTGSVITGDDYSGNGKWTTTAKKLLQNKTLLQFDHKRKKFSSAPWQHRQ